MVDFKKELAKKRGEFNKFLVIDCETSGVTYGDNPAKDCQMVSVGLIVTDIETFKPIEELYLEIRYNGKSKWDWQAEKVHGLTKDYLNKNGVTEIEAAEQIGGLLYEHFGIDNAITLCGHNVASFDVFFLKKLLYANDLQFKFTYRMIDTFSLGIATFGTFLSEGLFEAVGFEKRGKHNALEDARMALEAVRRINMLWKKKVIG